MFLLSTFLPVVIPSLVTAVDTQPVCLSPDTAIVYKGFTPSKVDVANLHVIFAGIFVTQSWSANELGA